MNKHIEKAMELRNETPMVNNCAQTFMPMNWGLTKISVRRLAVISVAA